MRWLCFLSFLMVGTWVYAEVFDLGDMIQYVVRLNARVDNLGADSLWVSEIEGGYTLAIGKDLKARANEAINKCVTAQQIDQKCFQQAVTVLEGALIQTDKQLDRRGALLAIGGIAKGWGTPQSMFLAMMAFLTAMWYENKRLFEGDKIYFPSPAAGKIANLPVATPITISAGGKPIATVTKPPVPTPTVKGSVTPAVTSVATAGGGFQAGDFAAVLDKDLASRLKDFMPANKDCRVGSDFDKANPSPSGRGTYGQALCASEAVVVSMQQGGPFRDLGQLKSDGVHFQFKSGPALSLTTELAEFIDTYAAMIFPKGRENDRGLRTDLAAFIAVLAIDLLVENLGLSERNLIKAAWVTVGGGSKPGCPDKKSLKCGFLPKRTCSLKFVGQGDKKTPVCSDGEFVDCECVAPLYPRPTRVHPDKIKAIAEFRAYVAGQKPIAGGPAPNCPVKITDIPADVFSNSKDKNMNIHNHFCQGWPVFKDEKKTMTVDSKGANVKPEPQRKVVVNDGIIGKRTPPANPDSFTNYQFELEFLPSGKGGACSMDCNAAFAKMAAGCAGSTPGINMYESGSLDVGCGRFAYHITKVETAKLIEQPRTCFEIKEYPDAQDKIVEQYVKITADKECRRHPDHKVKKADKSTYIQEVYVEKPGSTQPYYQFNIWWKEGCVLENNRLNEQSIHDPLDQKGGQGDIKCMETLLWIHKDCAAKSKLGGNIQLGCLMYEFIPTNKRRVFPER